MSKDKPMTGKNMTGKNMTGKTATDRSPADRKLPGKDLPWSVPLSVAQIPDDGSQVTFEADAAQRAALAALAGLRDVFEAKASFNLAHVGDATVHATGWVKARVGQTCVVTLDPVDNVIDEAIDVTFGPPSRAAPSHKPAAGEEGDHDDTPDPPEPIVGGTIDLGKVAGDFLFLGIDPYPRKSAVEFVPPAVAEDPEDHPFAALKALKAKPAGATKKPRDKSSDK